MADQKGKVRPVSFKADELYMLKALEEKYQPFSFSNVVKQLILKEIGGKKHYESSMPLPEVHEADYQLEAEREELEL